MKRIFSKKRYLISFFAGFFICFLFFSTPNRESHDNSAQKAEQKKAEIWTCSMHPNVQKNKPGKCPICFMDLILLHADSNSGENGNFEISEAAAKMAKLETSVLNRIEAHKTIRLTGVIKPDETRMKHVTAWVSGRIDKLHINYTGIPVKVGDHMAEFFSPELISAHEELLSSLKRPELLKAVKERLIKLGISKPQLETMLKASAPSDHMTINSPSSGIVIEKFVNEGMYVNRGTRLFSIVDLNQVWLIISAYERDVKWLKYGQSVDCEIDAFPGENYKGRISFISPVLDPVTRTVEVRVNLDNKTGQLKPGMFARSVIKVRVNAEGETVSEDMSGKWISPMHPEVIKDKPGTCDVCGMALVPAEQLGFAGTRNVSNPLIIPESAILWTGKRSIAYQKISDNKPFYRLCSVEIGSLLDEGYFLKSGLKEGDLVVSQAAFKIDSEQQLRGNESMMNPGKIQSKPLAIENQEVAKSKMSKHAQMNMMHAKLNSANEANLRDIFQDYFKLAELLSLDKAEATQDQALKAHQKVLTMIETLEQEPSQKDLVDELKGLEQGFKHISAMKEIKAQREGLSHATKFIKNITDKLGNISESKIYEMFCPMAFDNKGAIWFQNTPDLANPYFGSMMYKCGETRKTIEKQGNK